MKVYDLLHSVNKEKVFEILFREYEGQEENIDGYESMWNYLLNVDPQPDYDLVCTLSFYKDEDGSYAIIHGWSEESQQFYSIELVPWDNWLGMEYKIDENSNVPFPMEDEEFMAHILFEMSYSGYEPSAIDERRNEIMEAVKELDEFLASGRYKH